MAFYTRQRGFSATDLVRFLQEVEVDKISLLPPVWPRGNDVYVYRADTTDWRIDGFQWKWDGQKHVVSKSHGISFIRYDAVAKGLDRQAHRDFKRMGYRGHGYVVVVYLGDNSLALRSDKVPGPYVASVRKERIVTEKNSASYIKAILNVLGEMKQQSIQTKRAAMVPDEEIINALSNWPDDSNSAGGRDSIGGGGYMQQHDGEGGEGGILPSSDHQGGGGGGAGGQFIVLEDFSESQLIQLGANRSMAKPGGGQRGRKRRRGTAGAGDYQSTDVYDDSDADSGGDDGEAGEGSEDVVPFPPRRVLTGSGRVSKPPKHLIKDYIRVKKGKRGRKPGSKMIHTRGGAPPRQHFQQSSYTPRLDQRTKLAAALRQASDADFVTLALPRLAKLVSPWEHLLVRSEVGQPPLPSLHEVFMNLMELTETAGSLLASHLSLVVEDEASKKESPKGGVEGGKEEEKNTVDEVEEDTVETHQEGEDVIKIQNEKQASILGLPMGSYKQDKKLSETYLPQRYRSFDNIMQPLIKLVDLNQSDPTEQEVLLDSGKQPNQSHAITDEDLSNGRYLEVLGEDGQPSQLVMEAVSGRLFDRFTGQQVSLVDDNGQTIPTGGAVMEGLGTEEEPQAAGGLEEQQGESLPCDFVNIEDIYPGVQITPVSEGVYRVIRPDGAQYEIESQGSQGLTLDEVRVVMDID